MKFPILFWTINYLFLVNLAFAGDFKFVWKTNDTGKVVFPPDKYSKESYEYQFEEQATFDVDFKVKVKGQLAQYNYEKGIISKSSPKNILDAFGYSIHALALQDKYLNTDVATLINSGHLIEGQDYKMESGKFFALGKVLFSVEAPMDKNCRLTTINGKSLRTSWINGEQFFELPFAAKKPSRSNVNEVKKE